MYFLKYKTAREQKDKVYIYLYVLCCINTSEYYLHVGYSI